MSVIALMNMNGGTGKTTLALLAGTAFVERHTPVAIILSDRDSPIFRWHALPGRPETVEVVQRAGKMLLQDQINKLRDRFSYIIIDCETAAIGDMEEAASLSDLILIPVNRMAMEKEGVERTLALVRSLRRSDGRALEFAAVFNRSRTDKAVSRLRQHDGATLPGMVLNTIVPQREAYRYLFEYGGALPELANYGVRHLDVAVEAVRSLVNEIIMRLTLQKQQQTTKIALPETRREDRYWTARSMQLNLRVSPRADSDFRAIAERYGWSQAETFERAIALLLADKHKDYPS